MRYFMRVIQSDLITSEIKRICINANCILSDDMKKAIENSREKETSPTGKDVIDKIIENYKIAQKKNVPICQDTGMAVFFVEIGKDVFVEGKSITESINEGVRQGYEEGYLRKSIVKDPIFRENTKDNTPSVIHYSFTDGDKIKITFIPKGFGSENMSAIKMFAPSDGVEAIKRFVIQTVENAGSNPCPPIVVGVGIGGDFESSAILAKKAIAKEEPNENEYYRELEKELLTLINKLGIGPAGYGGNVTCLKVNIETAPTHIAGLPCAVNISCHASRHTSIII